MRSGVGCIHTFHKSKHINWFTDMESIAEGLLKMSSLKEIPPVPESMDELAIVRGPSIWARMKLTWRYENLWFTGNYPHSFGKLHWARAFGMAGSGCYCCSSSTGTGERTSYKLITPKVWLVWRLFVALYLCAIFVYSISANFKNGVWFWFLTNWQTSIFAIYGILSLMSAVFIYVFYRDTLSGDLYESAKAIGADHDSPETKYKMPLLIKATWIFHGLAMSLGIWVTVLFWLNVAAFGHHNPSLLPIQTLDHFSTMFIVLVDFSLAAFPWLIFQFVWSSFIAVAYSIWTIIFYNLGLKNPYTGERYM